MRLIDADALSEKLCETTIFIKDGEAFQRMINDAPTVSAEAENRLYIKIYEDDEPSVKAEKLYQICGETQNREVTEWLKEYFPSSADRPTGWIPVSERLPEDTSKPVLISGRHKKLGMCAVDIARYNGGMWQYDGFTFPDCDIIAWMPLPEPYKAGDSDDAL